MNKEKQHKDLIKQLKSSNSNAFKEVFETYQNDIFNFIFYKTGDCQTAEDILQDVFVKLWENRHNLKDNLSLKSYLYTIAKNLALNHLRHDKVVRKFQQQIEIKSSNEQSSSPQSLLEYKEFNKNLLDTLANLPEQQQVVFMMSRFDNLSYKEISERLNISIKTVETHIGKALKTLAKSLKL